MPTEYKVFFHQGPDLGLKTHILRGTAWIDGSALKIKQKQALPDISITDLQTVKLFRLHGMARVIRIDHLHGTCFLAVVRFMIGQFASVNFFKTGELYKQLEKLRSQTDL